MAFKIKYYSETLHEIVVARFGSYSKAAMQLDVSSNTIRNAVTAKSGVSRTTAKKLAAVLSLDFDRAFARTSSHPTRNDEAEPFQNQVARLLQLTGYDIFKVTSIEGIQVDFVARRRDLLANVEVLVECIYRREGDLVTVKDISREASTLLRNRQFIIIANTGFTAECKVFANEVAL